MKIDLLAVGENSEGRRDDFFFRVFIYPSSFGFVFFFFWLQPKPLQQLSGQICQICGDDVGLTADGELFVACNECAFPVCRTCYEYEREEGNQVCPQCKTRFKRLKGKHKSSS